MDRKSVNVRSYANIAIIKYWGKKDTVEMIPATSSISLTLENMYTETIYDFTHFFVFNLILQNTIDVKFI